MNARAWFAGLALCLAGALWAAPAPAPAGPPPNIVLILCDDLGYGDLGVFGGREVRTPNLDRMAGEGIRFTDFYAGQAVCSASRAGFMTGCYPNRVGILGALGPKSAIGLNPSETTVAEVLRGRGYATAIFGKWHLGDAPEFLPTRNGFDQFFGLPYSHDMWPFHPEQVRQAAAGTLKGGYPDLPLYENERVVNPKVSAADQAQLTGWYTDRAVQFIERNTNRPFFLYVPHNMPHVPLAVSEAFRGKSGLGLYADVILELDASVGRILAALRQHGLDERTLVIFTSDNGPWLLYGNHAGSSGPLREGKATVFDGGVRTPCLMRWPGRIPAGRVCREMIWSMDLLPTLARLAGGAPPQDRLIDGRDIAPLMAGDPAARSPHEAFFIYWGAHLQAVRSGPWKLHFAHPYPRPVPPGRDGQPGRYATQKQAPALYNLDDDIAETTDLSERHPDVRARLEALAGQARQDLGDSAQNIKGQGVRSAGRVAPPPKES